MVINTKYKNRGSKSIMSLLLQQLRLQQQLRCGQSNTHTDRCELRRQLTARRGEIIAAGNKAGKFRTDAGGHERNLTAAAAGYRQTDRHTQT